METLLQEAPHSGVSSSRFLWRLLALGALLIVELSLLSVWLDGSTLTRTVGLTALMGDWGPVITRVGVMFGIVFLAFGYLKNRTALQEICGRLGQTPMSHSFLAGHFGILMAFLALSRYLFSAHLPGIAADFISAVWMFTAAGVVALAMLAFAPVAFWVGLIRGTGSLWLYAALAGILSVAVGRAAESLWSITTDLTFRLVSLLLHLFVSNPFMDAATHDLGTRRFHVVIDKRCSGLEGAGLMLAFSSVWLWFFRKECRFPRSFLLIPAGIVVLWLANSLRITSLILIGNAGAPGVAVGGFHSQAGWIAFNLVALAFSVATRRIAWFHHSGGVSAQEDSSASNPAAAYLMPFLAILAAAMVSRAMSATFEWMYPLRFACAAGVLWHFRRSYKSMDWRFGWLGPLTGVIVFGLWIGLDRFSGGGDDKAIAAGLAALPAAARAAWLTFRVLAAVVTVPIAEELAFRGFLIRRLVSADFEILQPKTFTWVAILASSVAFGLMHGDRWIAGTVAGLLYAATFLKRGRMGEAVAAHATTNAMLAVWVLTGNNWRFW